jgi:translation initiation factor IF-3
MGIDVFLSADAMHPRFFYCWRCCSIASTEHAINEEITDKEVRLIGEEGEQLGILPTAEAQRLADEKELDLVMISPAAKPPVCKIMDYGKFRFEQAKREKEAKKNQRVMEVKEIRMSPGIGDNDFNTKLKNAQKFLTDGDRVKVTVRFRGREMAHTEIGKVLLRGFAEKCGDVGVLDKEPKLEGRNMSMFLSPKSQDAIKKAAKEKKKAQEAAEADKTADADTPAAEAKTEE